MPLNTILLMYSIRYIRDFILEYRPCRGIGQSNSHARETSNATPFTQFKPNYAYKIPLELLIMPLLTMVDIPVDNTSPTKSIVFYTVCIYLYAIFFLQKKNSPYAWGSRAVGTTF